MLGLLETRARIEGQRRAIVVDLDHAAKTATLVEATAEINHKSDPRQSIGGNADSPLL